MKLRFYAAETITIISELFFYYLNILKYLYSVITVFILLNVLFGGIIVRKDNDF